MKFVKFMLAASALATLTVACNSGPKIKMLPEKARRH